MNRTGKIKYKPKVEFEKEVDLFRKFGGKLGYYLADLKHKKYYCGLTDKDIQETLYSIGIGRRENA